MPVISSVFSRIWKFVDHRSPGDEVTRLDLDTALDDFVPAINGALAIVGDATTQAGIATTQAGVATTQAGIATGAAADAQASAADAQASATAAAMYDGQWLDTVSALIADTSLTYTAAQPSTVTAGDYVRTRAEGFAYQVAASGAVDQHITTAGGVKLYVLAGERGYNVHSFGVLSAISTEAASLANAAIWNKAVDAAAAKGGGTIYYPAGTFYFLRAKMLGNITYEGDGAASVMMQCESVASGYVYVLAANIGAGGTSSTADNLKNITVRGLHFKRLTRAAYTGAADAFQHTHLFSVSAVSNVLIEKCFITGFQGDGVLIASSNDGGLERHNENVTIRDCVFEGVDRRNRNAVSIIDCDGLLIENCKFFNCASNFMPGAIDIEPDGAVYHICKNMVIRNNYFENCGGTNGSIGAFFANAAWTVQPTNFLVEGNTIILGPDGADLGIAFVHSGDATTARSHDIKIVNNTVNGAVRGFVLAGIRNAVLVGNTFNRTVTSPIIGYTASAKCMNVKILSNFFNNIAADNASGGAGIVVFTVDHLDIHGNSFIDCGMDNGTYGRCLSFGEGTSTYVSLVANRFLDVSAKTTACIVKEAAHVYTPATNQLLQNTFLNVGSVSFEAHENDALWTDYAPTVTGSSTAGVGTYTRQYGRWRRIGKQVFFESQIVQTAHTGTGMAQIGLPYPAAPSGNNELKTLTAFIDGAATTGGQVGGINPAVSIGGILGGIRCYHTATGTISQTILPAGAATYYVSGTYIGA